MNQIKPHKLWIGHAGDGRDIEKLLQANIRAVVQLAEEEPPIHAPRDLIACRFPLVDGSGNDPELLYLAIGSAAILLKRETSTLVCSGAGMSRAPAIVAAAIFLTQGGEPADCLKSVTRAHPADVTPGLWEDVLHCLSNFASGQQQVSFGAAKE